MRKKWYVWIVACILVCLTSCGKAEIQPPELQSDGIPVMFFEERQKLFTVQNNYRNKIGMVSSHGKLVENVDVKPDFYYLGALKESKPDGYGLVYDRHGNLLFGGDFIDGKPCGYGIVFDADDDDHSDCYEGNDCTFLSIGGLERFRASGKGFVYSWDSFYGNNRPHILYAGELDKNDRSGDGIAYYEKTDIPQTICYAGSFKNDKYSGDGKLYSEQSRLIYEGQFRGGKYSGKGILYNVDGSVKYQGKFKHGEIKG